MTQEELTIYNIGQNLDNLMNLDPRGYGVCRILYEGSRNYTNEPLTTHCAKELMKTVGSGDLVYILTGFILMPHKRPETDGIVSSVILARALVKAFDAKPVIICPEECLEAVRHMAPRVGLHLYETIEELMEYPISMGVMTFTKDADQAEARSEELMAMGMPAAVIANECPGANQMGEYHNATGKNMTEIESKEDVLFRMLQEKGVWNMAIGDLGNEVGMGTIGEHIEKFIPYAANGSCSCGCGGGLLAATKADHIITATVSDWGCYGLIAALAFLTGQSCIMHTPEMEEAVMVAASRNGMVDMYGDLVPAIDGFDLKTNMAIVTMMRECIKYAPKLVKTCETWFEKTIELGFYEKVVNQ